MIGEKTRPEAVAGLEVGKLEWSLGPDLDSTWTCPDHESTRKRADRRQSQGLSRKRPEGDAVIGIWPGGLMR